MKNMLPAAFEERLFNGSTNSSRKIMLLAMEQKSVEQMIDVVFKSDETRELWLVTGAGI